MITRSQTLVVSAQFPDREYDLLKMVRSARSFQVIHLNRPDEHYTFRDGEKPHFTAQTTPWYAMAAGPIQIRAPSGEAKHSRVGWPSRWQEIDSYALAGGSGFLYREDVDGYPEAKIRRGVDRLALTLRLDEGLQIGHYLVRAGDSGSDFVASMAIRSHRALAWTCTRWDPWSIVIAETSVS